MRLSMLPSIAVLGVALLWGSGAKACDKQNLAIAQQIQTYDVQPVVVQEVRVQRVIQRRAVQRRVVQQRIVEQRIQQPVVQRSFSFQRTVIR